MSQEVIQLMKESESIIDLEQKLKQTGRKFNTIEKYEEWLKKVWLGHSEEKIEKILENEPKDLKIPTVSVNLEEIEYQIHGIAHGNPKYVSPGWHPRKKLIEFINTAADSFHNPDNGVEYFYEENFRMFFNLLKSQELKDQKNTTKKSESSLNNALKLTLSLPVGIIGSILSITIFGSSYLYSKTFKDPKTDIEKAIYATQKALIDPKYQTQLAEFMFAEKLPQPYDIEFKYLTDKTSKMHLLLQSMSLNPGLATRGERSLWTANALIKKAKEKNLKKVHYIGGLGHITEIEYFLKNPNYSFDKLEKYRLEKS